MQPVLAAAAAAELDKSVPDVGGLMDRAGMAVAIEAARLGIGYGSSVLVLAGPGNNGGDGYVAARHLLRRGVAVRVLALAEPKPGPGRDAAQAAGEAGVPIDPWTEPRAADLVIDAVFGAGFKGRMPVVVEPWTATESPVLAVDLPTGLDADSGKAEGAVFRAIRTVTFHAPKIGHFLADGPRECGELVVADIGLAGGHPTFWLTEEEDAPLPLRPRFAHKWSVGAVAVVGGSPGMTGAALLAGRAALRAGAGAVTVICPAGSQSLYAASAPELLTVGVGSSSSFEAADVPDVLSASDRHDVLVVGPGLGGGQEEFVAALLEDVSVPLLLDADAINALAGPQQLSADQVVITPHAGEFQRLTGTKADWKSAQALAENTSAVVLLKGSPTFVAGNELWAVTSNGPELATIGTGDVLAGAIGALWARGLDAEVAARSAAYWHGRAGKALASAGTITADVLADRIGEWIR